MWWGTVRACKGRGEVRRVDECILLFYTMKSSPSMRREQHTNTADSVLGSERPEREAPSFVSHQKHMAHNLNISGRHYASHKQSLLSSYGKRRVNGEGCPILCVALLEMYEIQEDSVQSMCITGQIVFYPLPSFRGGHLDHFRLGDIPP